MKGFRTFFIGIAILFVAMMFIEMATPKHFTWEPTFTHNDDQPFGSALFDSVMAASLPQGYTTTSLTLSQLETTVPADEHHVYLITTEHYPLPTSADEEALMRMMEKGNQFLIASGAWQSDTIESLLGFEVRGYEYLWTSLLKSNVIENEMDTMRWVNDKTQYSSRIWYVPDEICDAYIDVSAPSFKPLLISNGCENEYDIVEVLDSGTVQYVAQQTDVVAGVIKSGNGQLLVASCPFLFTNYGIIECDAATLVLRMLSQLERYPVTRLDPGTKTESGGTSESPLRYVLAQPPMKWAIWLLIVTVFLAMVFTARRKQRVIPIIEAPVNRSLEMVRHIGSLYFHRHDNADLLEKKYSLFVEKVRKLTMIDLNDENHIEDSYLQLQHQSGIPRDELRQQLQNIIGWINDRPSDNTLMRCIDYLNHILDRLK